MSETKLMTEEIKEGLMSGYKIARFPKELLEVILNHKSRWTPDSKGGEPNHY